MKEHVVKALSERQKCRDKVSVWFGSADNFYHPVNFFLHKLNF